MKIFKGLFLMRDLMCDARFKSLMLIWMVKVVIGICSSYQPTTARHYYGCEYHQADAL